MDSLTRGHVNETTLSDLRQQFEEDLAIIQRHMMTAGPLPLPDVRVILSPILRKWLLENNLSILCKAHGWKATLPAVDTSVHVEIIESSDGDFGFYCAGGALIDGAPLNSIYASNRERPAGMTSVLPVPALREYRIGHYLDRKCIYCEGEWVTNRDVIKFIANKAGGIHYDRDRSDPKQVVLEKARAFMHFGKRPLWGEPLSAPYYLEVSTNTPRPWDCLYVETLSMGQALLNVRINGTPLVGYEGEDADRWLSSKPVRTIFERLIGR